MDPKNKDYYKTNADKYIASLKDLDGKFSKIVKEGKRNTLVFADRFPLRYFVEQYKLKYFAAFPGCSAQTEPSASTLAFLINKAQEFRFHLRLQREHILLILHHPCCQHL